MRPQFIISIIVVIILLAIPADIWSQCPMCKIAAESNLENGGTAGKGLNNGILYIFVMPYILVSVLGFIWWRNRRTEEEEEELILQQSATLN